MNAKVILLMFILVSCFNKKEEKIGIVKNKGYLKELLKPEEREELKYIIGIEDNQKFRAFLSIHEKILKNYPIIVRVMKSNMSSRAKVEFNQTISLLMTENFYDENMRLKILTMKGKVFLPSFEEKMDATPLMAIAYYLPTIMTEAPEQFKEIKLTTNIDEKNDKGMTALMFASMSKDRANAVSTVRKLIAAGARVNEQDLDGRAALYFASRFGYEQVAEILLKEGAKLDERARYGITALHVAVENGHKEVVRVLLKARPNLEAVDEDGETALYRAALRKKEEIVVQLCLAGANVNAKNKFGQTAMYCAACKGHREVVEMLLKVDANVNEKNERDETALHGAARMGHKDIVEILLKAGASVNEKDLQGYTAVDWAESNGHKEIVMLLIKPKGKSLQGDPIVFKDCQW